MTDVSAVVSLVTGGASGIGRALCLRFANAGGRVVVLDVDRDGMDTLVRDAAALNGEIHPFHCDLSDRDSIKACAEQVRSDVGDVELLIHNAGIVAGAPLLELSDEQIERTFAINTLALFFLTREFLPAMVARDRGHIVTIASAGGLAGTAKLTDYCASKFAAVGFDDALRAELAYLGRNIDTTLVCPYYINTGMFDGVSTRFPALLPLLSPDYVVERIAHAIARRKRRLIMPRFVYTTWLVRLLPVAIGDRLMRFFGITESMDRFRGRSR
ncbi:MAG: SDR family oxidoreductase [Gammaproteobacteria bacterium]